MKKILLISLAAMVLSGGFAGEFTDKGLISDWKFAPLQVDVGLVHNRKLVDENTNTLFAFGLFILQQKSAVVSVAFVANTLQNNYGIQINPLIMGTATDTNYGISFGFENYCKKCYGMQLGIMNRFWDEGQVEKERELLQIIGINIADALHLGLFNISNKFQIGLFNISNRAAFQIGLLNYNHKSYLRWMPLVNWNMGREDK